MQVKESLEGNLLSWVERPFLYSSPPHPPPPPWCPSLPSPTRLLGDERPPTPAARSEVVLVYAAVIIIKLTIHSYYVETLKIYQAKPMCYFNLILLVAFLKSDVQKPRDFGKWNLLDSEEVMLEMHRFVLDRYNGEEMGRKVYIFESLFVWAEYMSKMIWFHPFDCFICKSSNSE